MARSTLWKHRKFRRLEMALKSKAMAAGVLECMWSCGYESGDDLLGTSEEVEKAAGWSGKRGALTPILCKIGWIDATDNGYKIHDLYDHAPSYVRRRQTRERERGATGAPLASQRRVTGAPLADLRSPLPTTTTTTTTKPTPTTTTATPSDSQRTPAKFELFWKAYPRKYAMGPASVAWVECVTNGDAEAIMSALEWQVRSDEWQRDGGRYVPKPETYLRERHWLNQPTKTFDPVAAGEEPF